MAQSKLNHVTIIGVGLLGGSAALAIKQRYGDVTIAGVGRRQSSLDEALKLGVIDTAHLDAGEAVEKSDMVILASPVGVFPAHLRSIAGRLKRDAVVTDVGSTKATVVRAGELLLGRGGPFVGSHPMAGSELKGAAFARADLFEDATCIITPTAHTPPRLTARVERFWKTLGMRTVRMAPRAHDRALASVSHLPHALAGLMMLMPKKDELAIAATGLRDMTRLASGDPEMWRDILLTNRKEILAAIDKFDESLMHLRDLVELGDARAIEKILASAKKRRDTTIGRNDAD